MTSEMESIGLIWQFSRIDLLEDVPAMLFGLKWPILHLFFTFKV
jgi:hypothetical protein